MAVIDSQSKETEMAQLSGSMECIRIVNRLLQFFQLHWFILKLQFLKLETAWKRKIKSKIKRKRTNKSYKFFCNSPIKSAYQTKLKRIGTE